MAPGDQVLAFFPCVRFEVQIEMAFRGVQNGKQKWTLEQKLEYDLKLHAELHDLYCLVTKLALVCMRRNLPLIIENPYSPTHYLVKYWCIPASIVDTDRRFMGDFYKKPTQYWFIGREPFHNFIFESADPKPKRQVANENKVNRSMISKDYANRFIREFIIPPCENGCDVKQ